MALRLRRGTDAERLLVTPLEGELIYTTDTKILYIGDGVTQGGLQVTGAFPESINDLNDVDIASFAPEVGQVLKWNGVEFIPANLIGSGEQANIDIIADDSTILVDSETQNFQGNIFTGDTFVGNLFNGTFVGDGSGLTNLPFAPDGSGIVLGSDYRINIAADDSTILVDSSTGIHRGTFEGIHRGTFEGDLQGSVFGDDSTLIIDSINNTVNASFESEGSFNKTTFIELRNTTSNAAPGLLITTNKDEDTRSSFEIQGFNDSNLGQNMTFVRSRGTETSPQSLQLNDEICSIYWFGTSADLSTAFISGINTVVDDTPGAGVIKGKLNLITADGAGDVSVLSLGSDGLLYVENNTLIAGANPGEVDDSAAVSYLKINVGGTDYALPLFAIRP